MAYEPVESLELRHPRAERLEALVCRALGVSSPADIPAKLGLAEAPWAEFLRYLAEGGALAVSARPILERVYGALRLTGHEDAYWEAMAEVRFPLDQAGVAWQRCLGTRSDAHDRLDHALAKLRLERVGLTVRRRVAIAGEVVDWAIAGLTPTGEVVRLAVVVREPASPLGALREDLADDAVALAGFELLSFRDWQLRYPGDCALHLAEHLAKRVPGLRLPKRLLEPEDGFILQRIQAAPAVLTPRTQSPNWALRESLRRSHPSLDRAGLLAMYEDRVIERTIASSDDEEWTVWG